MGKKDRTREGSALRPGGGGVALKFLERHRLLRALAIGILAALLALVLHWTGTLERDELASYDARVRSGAPGGRSDLVEIVAYDEISVQRFEKMLGLRFREWPRTVHADLVNFIARGKPRVIVIDLLFVAGAGQGAEDQDLVEACREAGNVILACNLKPVPKKQRVAGEFEVLPDAESARLSLGKARPGPAEAHEATWPLKELRESCRGLGSINLEVDKDKITRVVSPAVNYGGRSWPTLSMAAAAAYLGEKPELKPGLLRLGGRGFQLDARGRRAVFWYGPSVGLEEDQTARYRGTSAGWLLDSARKGKNLDAPERLFKDKIVLIGCSAAGTHEFRLTSVGREPGMYIHAAAIENLIRGESVRRVGGPWTAVIVLALAMLVALAFPGRGWQAALRGTGAYVLLAGGYLAGAYLVYSQLHLWIALITPQIGAGLSFGGSLLAGYLVEGRQVRLFRQAFSRFLSPEVLAEVSKNLDDLRPGMGRRREITMMFCDVRGFTPMSEKLEPEQVVELLDVYLEAMTDAIMATGGTLSKYLGDGIMAFWGAPQAVPDHAERTARAALDMVAAQEELKVRLADEGKPVFDIGIGLHTGPAVVGTVGSDRRMEYTAIGDTVNLASRVEQLTKQFGVRIVVTADFARGLRDKFEFEELGSVRVKGRSAEVKVLELKAVKESLEGSQ